MSFSSACGFLLRASARNLALRLARQLRRPQYLLAAVLGALYLASVVASGSSTVRVPRMLEPALSSLRADPGLVAGAFVALFLGLLWVLGRPVPQLGFTAAEVEFLFPAPAPRRALVHYALCKHIVLALPLGLAATLPFARYSSLPVALLAVAGWTIASILNLHAVIASMARAWLHAWLGVRRLRVAQGAGLALAALAASAWPAAWGPLGGWVVWPGRLIALPAVASDARTWLTGMVPATLALVAHYLAALHGAGRFEDATVELAERRARRAEAIGAGGLLAVAKAPRPRRASFRLSSRTPPELALAWSGSMAVARSRALLLFLAVFGATLGLSLAVTFALGREQGMPAAQLLGALASVYLLLVPLYGPGFLGGGIARALVHLDFLRSLPLEGRRIVLGLALPPALLLAAAWAVLVVPAAAFPPGSLSCPERAILGLSLAVVGPPVLLLGTLLQDGLTALLPGWVGAGGGPMRPGGLLVRATLNMLGLPILSVPAALAAWLPIAGAFGVIGWWSVLAGAALAAVVLVVEIGLALILIGHAFERIDPADP